MAIVKMMLSCSMNAEGSNKVIVESIGIKTTDAGVQVTKWGEINVSSQPIRQVNRNE